jgi:hypothetical protein
MNNNQARIVELLREAHLIAFKEIERLNLRIAELESQDRPPIEKEIINPAIRKPTSANQPSIPNLPEMLNDYQVVEHT